MSSHRIAAISISFVLSILAAEARAGFEMLAQDGDTKTVYVTRNDTCIVTLTNVGTVQTDLTAVTSNDQDASNGFFVLASQLPIYIPAGTSVNVKFVFAPNAPDIVSGARTYTAGYTFVFGGSGQVTGRVNGVGVVVRADVAASTTPRDTAGKVLTMPITLTSWTDPLSSVDMRGFTLSVTHYRPSIVSPDLQYNTSGAGQTGTRSAGAQATVAAQDTLAGTYQLTLANATSNILGNGLLMNLQFNALKGTDTSIFRYKITSATDASGATLPFVIITTSPGSMTVDSVKKKDTITVGAQGPVAPQLGLSIEQNSPNPFVGSTEIRFSLQHSASGRVSVQDMLGREVRRIAEGQFSAGTHTVSFASGTLPSGEYRVVLMTAKGTADRRMLLMR